MRKLIWCCSAAAVLTVGGFLSLAYHAIRCPDSFVGRTLHMVVKATVALQPLNGLTSLAARTGQAQGNETAVSVETAIPEDPQPVPFEPVQPAAEELVQPVPGSEIHADGAPIVIREDDPLPRAAAIPSIPDNTEVVEVRGQELPANGCPVVMPLCQDDDELPATPPRMPSTEESENKPAEAQAKAKAGSSTKTEQTVFAEWMKLFEEGEAKQEQSSTVEELPPPVEMELQGEGKCQVDSHRNEQYPGCPRVSCPYRDRNMMEQSYKRPWDLDPKLKKKGAEESSEEPPQTGKKHHSDKESKKEEQLRTQGVDTMEYRPSDAGLNEYGPGPDH